MAFGTASRLQAILPLPHVSTTKYGRYLIPFTDAQSMVRTKQFDNGTWLVFWYLYVHNLPMGILLQSTKHCNFWHENSPTKFRLQLAAPQVVLSRNFGPASPARPVRLHVAAWLGSPWRQGQLHRWSLDFMEDTVNSENSLAKLKTHGFYEWWHICL